ncbi:MAG: Coenzyme PQQ synthesis protein E [Candidatus Woesearchaeota archaeon]|nr:Coenzyme PQQ synthesis protein E [Candidatus Woesearchaeota archaeon]
MESIKSFKEKDLPNNVLFITNQCNNNCIICQDKVDQVPLKKEFREIKKEIDEMCKNGIKTISLYGGEPFLRKDLDKIIRYIVSKNIRYQLFTNARIFYYKKYTELIKKIKGSVVTSLFSYNAEIHDKITSVKGSHRQTLRGIENLVEEGIKVVTTIVLTRLNVQDLKRTCELLVEQGVYGINISGLIKQGRMNNKPSLIPKFSDVKSFILETKPLLENSKTHYWYEKLPICVDPSSQDLFSYERNHVGIILTLPEDIEKCGNCDLKNKCIGYVDQSN